MNKEINFKELREKLTPEDIKKILSTYDVKPVLETDKYLIFPTVCHNLTGGSNKLYYYTNSKMFRCYTECNQNFDIFELLIKMHKLRGSEINIFTAIKLCDLEPVSFFEQETDTTKADIEYLYNLLKTKNSITELPPLDKELLNRFIFDMRALKIWQEEGISFNTMLRYGISYDPLNNCIIIPNFDINGKLISVRGRYFDGEAKYKPIIFGDKVLSHPSAMNLYGINITKQSIQKNKKVIIYEGERINRPYPFFR